MGSLDGMNGKSRLAAALATSRPRRHKLSSAVTSSDDRRSRLLGFKEDLFDFSFVIISDEVDKSLDVPVFFIDLCGRGALPNKCFTSFSVNVGEKIPPAPVFDADTGVLTNDFSDVCSSLFSCS